MTPLFFVIVFTLGAENKVGSLVLDSTLTLEECATKKKSLEQKHELRLRESKGRERIECVMVMGTV